jgi:hypothetical protein
MCLYFTIFRQRSSIVERVLDHKVSTERHFEHGQYFSQSDSSFFHSFYLQGLVNFLAIENSFSSDRVEKA